MSNPELKLKVKAAIAELALSVQENAARRMVEALDKLTADEIDAICDAPRISPTERYPMRGAKVLLLACGQRIVEDFDSESVQVVTKQVKRVLKNRV